MTKRKLPWWQWPSVIVGGVTAFGVLGTLAVHYATYEQMPSRLEAAEQKNAQQDEALNRLAAVEETWQKIYTQQQQWITPPLPAPQTWSLTDAGGPSLPIRQWDVQHQRWVCCDSTTAECLRDGTWRFCE